MDRLATNRSSAKRAVEFIDPKHIFLESKVEMSSSIKKFRNTDVQHRGFTLVELLVVIAIIGILIGMLLPAVQQVREAARRVACQNNMRQFGLAILNFESGSGVLPPGGFLPQSSEHDLDFSWIIRILPFAEANNMHDLLEFSLDELPGTSARGYHDVNKAALRNQALPMVACPSSDMEQVDTTPSSDGIVRPFYTGIHGSAREETSFTPTNNPTLGLMSDHGVFQRNVEVKLAEIFDGTSNTMIVGEQSGWLIDENGEQVDERSDCSHSIILGSTPQWERIFNSTVVRYPFNHRDSVDDGIQGNCARNGPLTSSHPGGINGLFVDGSVHFLPNATGLDVVFNLADRDDGLAVGDLP